MTATTYLQLPRLSKWSNPYALLRCIAVLSHCCYAHTSRFCQRHVRHVIGEYLPTVRQARMQDLDQATAEQEARWDDHAAVYTEIVIRKDQRDIPGHQFLAAINKHNKFPDGMSAVDQDQLLKLASVFAYPVLKLCPS